MKPQKLVEALEAIVFYIRNVRPATFEKAVSQMKVIEEIALGAVEEAKAA